MNKLNAFSLLEDWIRKFFLGEKSISPFYFVPSKKGWRDKKAAALKQFVTLFERQWLRVFCIKPLLAENASFFILIWSSFLYGKTSFTLGYFYAKSIFLSQFSRISRKQLCSIHLENRRRWGRFFVPLSFLELYQIILCLAEFLSHNNNSTRGSGSQVKLFSLQLDPQIAIKINRAAHHWANRRDQALSQQLFYSNFYK